MTETNSKQFDVVGCGALNMDYFFRLDHIAPGTRGTLQSARICPGGSSADTIYALAKLELNVGFVGVVGDDERGLSIIEDMRRVGVDTSRIATKMMTQSGSVLVLSDRKGHHSAYVLPGANELMARADIDMAFACNAKFLHLSSFEGAKQMALQLDMADCATSTKISLTLGKVYARLGLGSLVPLLRKVHVLFLDSERLKVLTGQDVEHGAKVCQSYGAKIVAVTLGGGVSRKDGLAIAYVLDGNEGRYIVADDSQTSPAYGESPVSAFAAGFLFGLVKGKPMSACALLGHSVAKFTHIGQAARDGLPSLDELARLTPSLVDL
jgi:sugar/nucleoside kinase (ribokinase family)